jgi:MoaA/NifB/PqqE/SkfB family radical SAM enzyme
MTCLQLNISCATVMTTLGLVRLSRIGFYLRGHKRTAVFAVTCACNCRCMMCNMHALDPAYVGLRDAQRALDFLYENKFMVVYFTGGEPTLHPDLVSFVRYASRLGLVTSMTTNGTSPTATITRLKKAGLDVLSVSLDHWTDGVCETIRCHSGIKAKQEHKLRHARRIGMRVYALAYLGPFLCEEGAVETFVRYVNDAVGVPVAFCFPTSCDENSYRLSGVGSDVDYARLGHTIQAILRLKREGHHILNPTIYLEDTLRFLHRKPPTVDCKGGEEVVYVDWRGDVFPCFLQSKLFNVLEDEPRFLSHVHCSRCVINCFREPSIFAQFPRRSLVASHDHQILSFLFGRK